MSQPKSKFTFGLGQGFAKMLKKGVNASLVRRNLTITRKEGQDRLYRKHTP